MCQLQLTDVEVASTALGSDRGRRVANDEAGADDSLVSVPPLGLSFTLHVARSRVEAARKMKELRLPAQATGAHNSGFTRLATHTLTPSCCANHDTALAAVALSSELALALARESARSAATGFRRLRQRARARASA